MTRFVYLSDTHWGIETPGYTMQASQPSRLPELLAALEAWMDAHGPVDFVLHGGDMIDSTREEHIDRAAEMFRLSVPVYLCLGNHDLTREHAAQIWLDRAPHLFLGGVNFTIETPDCLIHVVPNQWGAEPYVWNGVQEPHFLPEQERFIEAGLERQDDRIHILSTHSPFCGVPADQTGLTEPFHRPPQGFVEWGEALCAAHRSLHCVLGAHSHINTCVAAHTAHFVTSSSFVEMPFDFKCFDLADGYLSMTTHSLAHWMGATAGYDYEKTFVQGRACDRAFGR